MRTRPRGAAALALPAVLSACAAPPVEAPAPGLANPAAVFCIKSGGTVIPRETAQGTQGWCHLPSGLMVEEWAFFTAAQGAPTSPDAPG